MSKLQELIDRLCPNGVDFKPLGEVCEFQRGDTLSSKDAIEGDVPVRQVVKSHHVIIMWLIEVVKQ